MTELPSSLLARVAELRLAFDRSFAERPTPDTKVSEDLLAIRLEGEPSAFRLAETTGLFVDKKITPMPGRSHGLLGIAGFRGVIVPVYDLQAVIGYPAARTPRWLVMMAAAPVALAFEAFEGHLRLLRDAILPRDASEQARKYLHEFAQTGGFVRSIVHLPAVLDAIRALARLASPKEER